MEEVDLLTIFNTVIRPTLEYAVPTYHPMMLNQEMAEDFEQIQKRASKLIFGWHSSYDEVISSGKMETLDSRRENLTKKFALKTSKNKRFGSWFREKDYGTLNLRSKKKFEEDYARTERMRKSPVYYMQRILNENVN